MYQSPLVTLPTDLEIVWIRAYNQYSSPVQATYHSGTKLFTTLVTLIDVPAYFVSRWKSI